MDDQASDHERKVAQRKQDARLHPANAVKTPIVGIESDEGAELSERGDRVELVCYNQGGFDCTVVDLPKLIKWLKEHRPHLLA